MIDTPDHRVASLSYFLKRGTDVTYANPPDVTVDADEATFSLSGGVLTCRLKRDLSSEDDARAMVEPFLHAWESDSDLRWGGGRASVRVLRRRVDR